MSNGIKHLFKHRVKRSKSNTARLAARLAPLEEQSSRISTANEERAATASQEAGTIVVDKNSVQIPKEMMESRPGGFMGMEPVVIVILGIMLGFIAFVAWQISGMPLD